MTQRVVNTSGFSRNEGHDFATDEVARRPGTPSMWARLPQTARKDGLRTCQALNFITPASLCSVAWRSSNTLPYINRHYCQW
jgi:hypothetical protein